MGKQIVSSLASLATCMSLGAIVSYLGLFRSPLFQGFHYPPSSSSSSSPFASLSFKPLPLVTLTSGYGACNCSSNPLAALRIASHIDTPTSSVNCTCNNSHAIPASTASCSNATQSVASPASDASDQGSGNRDSAADQHEPWYARGKTWHYPVLFPRCSMDACFNYSRCDGADGLLIYSYDIPSPPVRYFTHINSTQWHTDDADKACLFFVFLAMSRLHRPHPNTLPYWNNGMNHVLVTFADMWNQRELPQQTIGYASVMASKMHETIYRPGFDISIPLPGKMHAREMQTLKPYERKYLLTFRGLRYLGRSHEEGVLRSFDAFRSMHNGNDVIVVTSCKQATNNVKRREAPELGANCDEDEALYGKYVYKKLMNTTFGLVPSGRQPNSYRMMEVLSAGVVPVLVADNYVKPFDTLIQWHRCMLQFPSSEMHRIVPTIRAMKPLDVERRQEYCIHIYNTYLKDDDALLSAAVTSLKARLLGSLPLNP